MLAPPALPDDVARPAPIPGRLRTRRCGRTTPPHPGGPPPCTIPHRAPEMQSKCRCRRTPVPPSGSRRPGYGRTPSDRRLNTLPGHRKQPHSPPRTARSAAWQTGQRMALLPRRTKSSTLRLPKTYTKTDPGATAPSHRRPPEGVGGWHPHLVRRTDIPVRLPLPKSKRTAGGTDIRLPTNLTATRVSLCS